MQKKLNILKQCVAATRPTSGN